MIILLVVHKFYGSFGILCLFKCARKWRVRTSFNLVQKRNLKFEYDYYFLNTLKKKRTFLSVGGKGASRAEHNTSLISGTFVRKKKTRNFFTLSFLPLGIFFLFPFNDVGKQFCAEFVLLHSFLESHLSPTIRKASIKSKTSEMPISAGFFSARNLDGRTAVKIGDKKLFWEMFGYLLTGLITFRSYLKTLSFYKLLFRCNESRWTFSMTLFYS